MKALIIKEFKDKYLTMLTPYLSDEEASRKWISRGGRVIRYDGNYEYYKHLLSKQYTYAWTVTATYKCSHCKKDIPPETRYIKIKYRKYHEECLLESNLDLIIDELVLEVKLQPFKLHQIEDLRRILFPTALKKKSDMQFLSAITQSIIESTKIKTDIQRIII